MITGSLKNKVEAIRQDFYNENKTQSSDVVDQLTMLMFIKMLDDKQNAIEAQARKINIQPKPEDLTFKKGDYKNYELINGQKVLKYSIPYEDLRWKNFKNLNPSDLSRRIRDYVIPFVMDADNKVIGKFAEYSREYSFGFGSKERLLASVVDKLSDDEFNFVNTDLMGDVYEYICGSGISGQYRTPRHIIDMAIEMMKPKLGEKIIDPAMGTAGFIIESAKYIQKHQENELFNTYNRKIFNSETFYGVDNDTTMARIGYMNCILHNVKNPSITTESLLEHDNAKNFIGEFDLVLQNPPFSGSLIKEAISGQLLTLTKTGKTELLFVALMLQLMKIGGRGMSIVPDGVLSGSSKAHISLRKELVEHQRLIGIISMPAGIFAAPSKKGSSAKGAGVKTSFLIFEKTNNGGTNNVWFYDMTADGFSLDTKRTPTNETDIPDILDTFAKLDNEIKKYNLMDEKSKIEQRKNKWFFIQKDLIVKNKYELGLIKYKLFETPDITYRPTNDILNELKIINTLETELFSSISSYIND